MRQYPDFSYLKACCYINCILPGILFFIPYIGYYSPISQMDEMIYIGNIILHSLVYYLPCIVTMGLIFIYLGSRHKEEFGKFLMYAGIFWTVHYIWAAIFLLQPGLPNIIGLTSILRTTGFLEFYTSLMLNQVINIGYYFNTLATISIIIHGYFNKDRNLRIAGLILIMGAALMGLSLIPSYMTMYILHG